MPKIKPTGLVSYSLQTYSAVAAEKLNCLRIRRAVYYHDPELGTKPARRNVAGMSSKKSKT